MDRSRAVLPLPFAGFHGDTGLRVLQGDYRRVSDDSGRLPILRENNCPYLELASSDPAICELEKEVFRKVLGSEVELTQCCLDGHTCCEFQPVSAER